MYFLGAYNYKTTRRILMESSPIVALTFIIVNNLPSEGAGWYNIQCGNYLWNKFSHFKTNDVCRKH
jgi:hypothetical protein